MVDGRTIRRARWRAGGPRPDLAVQPAPPARPHRGSSRPFVV